MYLSFQAPPQGNFFLIMRNWYWKSAVVALVALVGTSAAFSSLRTTTTTSRTSTELHQSQQPGSDDTNMTGTSRRAILGTMFLAPLVVFGTTEPAQARDELFRANPLTNPLLEQMRILEQAEKDNIQYGGELAAGDAGNKGKVDQYPKLLVPILAIQQELNQVDRLIHVAPEDRASAWPKALAILKNGKYDKIAFKKTFNAYGDNIYYSDPDRANAYLGGGATPKTEQSLAYLLRNDILTNVENLTAELEYLIKDPSDGTDDLYSYIEICTSAMSKYLDLVPPAELEASKKML